MAPGRRLGFDKPVRRTYFITGTDTGVGKTVLAALWVRYLRRRGGQAAALKPVGSGGRADARLLRAAMDGALPLAEINPWHFRAPLAPRLAARRERKSLHRAEVAAGIRAAQKKFDVLLVEGAGGLLSPLGEDFNSRDLIAALGATPVIVAPNRLGVVNHVLLALEALPRRAAAAARVVLMSPASTDAAGRANAGLLAEETRARVFVMPWLGEAVSLAGALRQARVRRVLAALG